MKENYSDISPVQSIAAAVIKTTANGSGVDLQDYEGATVIVTTGTVTDGTHTISLEESSDNSTFTAVAATDMVGSAPAIAAADDNKDYSFGYIGSQRYIRVVTTVTGSPSTGGAYAAVVLRGFPRHAPVN